MNDVLLDLLFPATDKAVQTQWIVAAIFWVFLFVIARKVEKNIRLFLLGLFLVNLGWFFLRAAH